MKYLLVVICFVACTSKSEKLDNNISMLKAKRDSLEAEYKKASEIRTQKEAAYRSMPLDDTGRNTAQYNVGQAISEAASLNAELRKVDKQIEVLEMEKLKGN